MTLRVDILRPTLGAGGADRVTLTLLRGLDRSRFAPRLVLLRREGELMDRVPPELEVVELGARSLWTAAPPLARHLRRSTPDVLLSTSSGTNPLAVAARALARVRCPVVISERTVYRRDGAPGKRLLLNRLKRATYRHADRVTAVSEGVARDLVRHFRLPEERVEVVLNPVVTPRMLERSFHEVEHPWVGDASRPLLLGAGRLVPAKGFDLLIEALARIRRTHDARLVLLGDGPERETLLRRAAERGVAEAVDLPGWQEEPWAWMRRATVFVLPSRFEGLPGVLIEAMACGAAVVAADCHAGPREIVTPEEDGLLVPVGDPGALSDAVARLLDDQGLRTRLGARAAQSAGRFSVDEVLGRYERVLAAAVATA
ncbi:MAG: glycosyltransferase [Thermoanaerobaculia bacterium]|nr:glycosyltransferase [Thermoanaerobaculia bacterium]